MPQSQKPFRNLCCVWLLFFASSGLAANDDPTSTYEIKEPVAAPIKVVAKALADNALIPSRFHGIWGSSFETCDDENIGLRLLVRADFLSLTDWSKPDWVLLVKSVTVDANDSRSIIIYFDPPKPLSKSPDYEPVVRFDKFGKMTMSEDGQMLIVSNPASATNSVFVFCSALSGPDKKAG